MERSIYYYLGIAAGIILGVIILAIVSSIRKKNGNFCEYDERQVAARGKAYKYGFFTFIIYFAAYGILQMATDGEIVSDLVGITVGIVTAVFVFASNAIWNDAYFSLQESPRYYIALFLAVGGLNLVVGFRGMIEHRAEGILDENIMNLSCGVLFVGLLLVTLVKLQKDKRQGEAE